MSNFRNPFPILALALFSFTFAIAQDAKPDNAIADVELGNRESAKALLADYGPTFGDDGRPEYYFYNKYADQVVRFKAASWQDKFLITEMEVFAVTDKYRRPHFQLKEIGYFKTPSGLFLGYKQSAVGLLSGFAIGINDPGGKNRVRKSRVQKLFGEPDETVEDGERATFVYHDPEMTFKDLGSTAAYRAEYEFKKGKLKRISLKIESESVRENL
ncbi:MAG: hypothetical protein DWQ47_07960 [Acidobacteria bacterium]|nr:MAG: hypothetical protein DWQ32_16060 [Acidobacteriota bacterium]REJ99151.1 MAG: hypothetical protein DWQ38_13915 [Acidobacteriota bacterium]REK16128.1 MAG: hypothetical protein DWQ43_03770 [Acidobacteriota bacterium]REK43809.1 MAG: hypothetical protein DWQ47_07960 [Acidobacteriota bacterium]